jgi:hypothetical protein
MGGGDRNMERKQGDPISLKEYEGIRRQTYRQKSDLISSLLVFYQTDTFHPQKLALTSPTRGGRSVGSLEVYGHGVKEIRLKVSTLNYYIPITSRL